MRILWQAQNKPDAFVFLWYHIGFQMSLQLALSVFCLAYFSRFYLFIFRYRGKEGEMEKNINLLLLTCPQMGTWPRSQACALTRNQSSDLSVRRLMLNPLSHTSQGSVSEILGSESMLFFCVWAKLCKTLGLVNQKATYKIVLTTIYLVHEFEFFNKIKNKSYNNTSHFHTL